MTPEAMRELCAKIAITGPETITAETGNLHNLHPAYTYRRGEYIMAEHIFNCIKEISIPPAAAQEGETPVTDEAMGGLLPCSTLEFKLRHACVTLASAIAAANARTDELFLTNFRNAAKVLELEESLKTASEHISSVDEENHNLKRAKQDAEQSLAAVNTALGTERDRALRFENSYQLLTCKFSALEKDLAAERQRVAELSAVGCLDCGRKIGESHMDFCGMKNFGDGMCVLQRQTGDVVAQLHFYKLQNKAFKQSDEANFKRYIKLADKLKETETELAALKGKMG